MELSIIIVNWNTKKLLLECLDSLETQLNGEMNEIIVVDNDSQDGSPEAVQAKFPHVKLVCNQVNVGFSRANNIGLAKSTGRYVILVNSDVIALPGSIQLMRTYMDENESVGLLGPRVLNADGTLQQSCTKFPTIWNMLMRALGLDRLIPSVTYFSHDKVGDVDALSGCLLMARREAIGSVGFLDEGFFIYAEDKDWCKRFKETGWRVVYFPSAEIIHFGGSSSSLVPIKSYLQMQDANLRYWKKHYPRKSQMAFYYILLLHQILRLVAWTVLTTFDPRNKTQFNGRIERSRACLRWLWGLNFP